MSYRARRSKSVKVAILIVAAAGAVNVVLAGQLIRGSQSGPSNDPMAATSTIFLLAAVILPVAVMFYVVRRPLPTAASRRSLLAGSVVFFALNIVLTGITLTSDSSTASLGFLTSVPVLLGVGGTTALIAFPRNPAKR